MSEKSMSLSNKMARLRGIFVQQLPGKMAEARRIFDTLRTDPSGLEAAESLHRHFHTVKGTGASLGLLKLSALSAEGEEYAKAIVENPDSLTSESWQKLDECLINMERMLEHSFIDEGNTPGKEQQKPVLDMPSIQRPERENANERLIYICEGEVLLAEQLGAQLHCFGYETALFNAAADLRQAILRNQPDAVVVDTTFLEGDSAGSKAMIDLLAKSGISFPSVFISGRRDFSARLQAIRAGGEAFFPKPVNAMDLVVTLDLLTRQSKPEPFRVLVVDDEPNIAQTHCLILRDAGMVTKAAHEPETMLDVVTEFRPDLVLMDMYMPKCSGREAAKLIRQITDFVSLPIVFLSSETDTRKRLSAMEVGAEGFLSKGIQPEELVREVALRADRMRTLRGLMARDSMTGLFNHSTTNELLSNAINASRRQNSSLCFAMIDVDRFKLVNDTYGHPVGDQVLLALARVLQQRLRKSDLVGRDGGDEFSVILKEALLDKAEQIMDQVREEFSMVVFNIGDARFTCTFSCGVASFPPLNDMESMREAADKALYQAKHAGRNRVVAYTG